MDIDMLEVGHSQQTQDVGNHFLSEIPKEPLRVNGMVPNQTEMTTPER
jgi:hypothetical protein